MRDNTSFLFKTLVAVLLLLLLCPAGTMAFEPKNPYISIFDGERRRDTINRDTLHCGMYMDYPRSSLIKRPVFLNLKYSGGNLLRTDESLRGANAVSYAQGVEARVGFMSLGNRWKDIVYGMPYYGIGVGHYGFNREFLGNPFSVYLFQGATLKSFSARSYLKAELNLGASFNWNPYHPVANPGNECISAKLNAYFAAHLYYTYIISKTLDLQVGMTFSHVSNGGTTLPNAGINTVAGFVGITHVFDRACILNEYNPSLQAPKYRQSRLISDIMVNTTVRQRRFPTDRSGLSSQYIQHRFFVANVSYALLHMPNYRYRYGLALDGIYDESLGFSAVKAGVRADGSEVARINRSNSSERFSLGASVRGEVVMPKSVITLMAGYEFYRKHDDYPAFYQAFSIKVPFWENLYGSFSVRAGNFGKVQYLFLGLGYTIDHKPFR